MLGNRVKYHITFNITAEIKCSSNLFSFPNISMQKIKIKTLKKFLIFLKMRNVYLAKGLACLCNISFQTKEFSENLHLLNTIIKI